MISSPFKNLFEKNEEEKVELVEAKANRVLMNNKNGDKTKKRKTMKAKKKLILNSIENPVPSTSSANNEGTICPGCEQTYDEDWMQCGYYVRSGGMRNVPVTKAVKHLYATTAKFSGAIFFLAFHNIYFF
ncbi:hypothetical protein AVEN_218930-1 [Araneus ventricosus]|uniref:Uncharacterized protein n=1 Tax=Araneus ventricosus TaxID=182803 RepID=A0A4Y2H4D2_ARAVE|nr:hypothetical protein AVEN_218930-1 [Araneus ventricosus]